MQSHARPALMPCGTLRGCNWHKLKPTVCLVVLCSTEGGKALGLEG